ncbi:MAG: class I SAM-dependent methyltransferase [Desulfobacteraceae bacterium]|nr:class I SAM-dependent methyltransferase [Desulfobacteraceae bacterium]
MYDSRNNTTQCNIEFGKQRSERYKKAINAFTNVWSEDRAIMFSYLSPQKGELILEVGAGSGFFSFDIADRVGSEGHIYITDPSEDQLQPIQEKKKNNMTILTQPAEAISIDRKVDKIWTRGAFHHVLNKTEAFSCWYNASKPGAKLVVFDIFSPSSTARFFDSFIARTCTTGHEVSFLTKEFANSLCKVTGWERPEYIDIPLRWQFSSLDDIGAFLSLLLSSKEKYTKEDFIDAAKNILGIIKIGDQYYLNWPMTIMISKKTEKGI